MTTAKFFDTKDQFIAFRKAFAAAQNDPRAKPSFSPPKEYTTTANGKRVAIPVNGRVKIKGWLTSAHFMLFNIVRGLPADHGFTNKTSEIYIKNGGQIDLGYRIALVKLFDLRIQANRILSPDPITHDTVKGSWWGKKLSAEELDKKVAVMQSQQNSYEKACVNAFLEPLNGAFTVKQLANIKLSD